MKVYSAKRKTFLETHRLCQVCEARPSCDVHHVQGRLGGAYLNENTWLAVCRRCHDHIHFNPKESREKGLLK